MVTTMDRNIGALRARMIACKASGATVPATAYGLIKSIDSNGLALIGKPDANSISAGRLVITMPGPGIPDGGEFYALPADAGNLPVLISGTTPAVGDAIGTESGNWYAVKGKRGFKTNGVAGGRAFLSPFNSRRDEFHLQNTLGTNPFTWAIANPDPLEYINRENSSEYMLRDSDNNLITIESDAIHSKVVLYNYDSDGGELYDNIQMQLSWTPNGQNGGAEIAYGYYDDEATMTFSATSTLIYDRIRFDSLIRGRGVNRVYIRCSLSDSAGHLSNTGWLIGVQGPSGSIQSGSNFVLTIPTQYPHYM